MNIIATIEIAESQQVTSIFEMVERVGQNYLVFNVTDQGDYVAIPLHPENIVDIPNSQGEIVAKSYSKTLSIKQAAILPTISVH